MLFILLSHLFNLLFTLLVDFLERLDLLNLLDHLLREDILLLLKTCNLELELTYLENTLLIRVPFIEIGCVRL